LSVVGVGAVTVQAAEAQFISGTVHLPAGHAEDTSLGWIAWVCWEDDGWDCREGGIASDGTYRIQIPSTAAQDIFVVAELAVLGSSLLLTAYAGPGNEGVAGNSLYETLGSASPVSVPANVTEVTGIDITMQVGAKLKGTVALADGASIADAGWVGVEVCEIVDDEIRGCVWANYSSDGSYEAFVKPGVYTLRGSADNYLTTYLGGYVDSRYKPAVSDVTSVTVPASGATAPTLTLEKGVIISGTIKPLDAARNASVDLYCVDDYGYLDYQDYTWANYEDGAYVMSMIPGRECSVRVTAPGYLTTWLGDVTKNWADVDEVTILTGSAGQELKNQDITLPQAASFTGKVTMPGHTLPSNDSWYGWVEACGFEGSDLIDCVSSGWIEEDGSYTIDDVKPGTEYYIFVEIGGDYLNEYLMTGYDGWAGLRPSFADQKTITSPNPGESKTVNITMKKASYIEGTVYLPDGETPAENLGIEYCWYEGSEVDCEYSWSDSGSYSLRVVPGVEYFISAYVNGYPQTWYGDEPLGLSDDPKGDGVPAIVAPAEGATLGKNNITLTEGVSISGNIDVKAVSGTSESVIVTVTACYYLQVTEELSNCQQVVIDGVGGQYTIQGLLPGKPHVVFAEGIETCGGDCYDTVTERSWHGGGVGWGPNVVKTVFTTPKAGSPTLTGKDITLWDPSYLTGKVVPSSLAGDAQVWLCPVYMDGSQSYYGQNKWYANEPIKPGVWSDCWPLDIDETGEYGSYINPGYDWVVIGQAPGYTDTWHGGYVGDSGLVEQDKPVSTVVPNGATILTFKPGETKTNVDVIFGNSVSVSYNANGGSGTMSSQSVDEGSSVTLAANGFTYANVNFDGWNTKADGSGTPYKAGESITPTANLTLYAQWKAVVKFDTDGGSTAADLSVTPGSKVALPADPTKDGFKFAGWINAADNTTVDAQTVVNGHMTVKAQWKKILTLTYDPNGGSEAPVVETVLEGDELKIAANSFTNEGLFFKGYWTATPEDAGTHYFEGESLALTENMTLYAQWVESEEDVVVPVTVIFDVDGAQYWVSKSELVDGSATVSLPSSDPTPARGFDFGGWCLAAGCTSADFTGTVTGNTTVYVFWAPKTAYFVSFDANSGSGEMVKNGPWYVGESYVVPASTFTRDGYTFGGWLVESQGGSIQYNVGQSFTVSGDVTLVAMWVEVVKDPVAPPVKKPAKVSVPTGGSVLLSPVEALTDAAFAVAEVI
jgi:uncharacterized repeat protein (TIGR02543 family)